MRKRRAQSEAAGWPSPRGIRWDRCAHGLVTSRVSDDVRLWSAGLIARVNWSTRCFEYASYARISSCITACACGEF